MTASTIARALRRQKRSTHSNEGSGFGSVGGETGPPPLVPFEEAPLESVGAGVEPESGVVVVATIVRPPVGAVPESDPEAGAVTGVALEDPVAGVAVGSAGGAAGAALEGPVVVGAAVGEFGPVLAVDDELAPVAAGPVAPGAALDAVGVGLGAAELRPRSTSASSFRSYLP